jgi:hypothetical protein
MLPTNYSGISMKEYEAGGGTHWKYGKWLENFSRKPGREGTISEL